MLGVWQRTNKGTTGTVEQVVTVKTLNCHSNRHRGSTEDRGWEGSDGGYVHRGDQAQGKCIALYQRSANEAFLQS